MNFTPNNNSIPPPFLRSWLLIKHLNRIERSSSHHQRLRLKVSCSPMRDTKSSTMPSKERSAPRTPGSCICENTWAEFNLDEPSSLLWVNKYRTLWSSHGMVWMQRTRDEVESRRHNTTASYIDTSTKQRFDTVKWNQDRFRAATSREGIWQLCRKILRRT